MHAEAFQRQKLPPDEGLGRAIAWAVGLHLLLLAVLLVSPYFKWDRERLNAAGSQSMEATLDVSAADARAVERALDFQPPPLPEPVEEPAPEDTVPPPQPIPEPSPQDAPIERQAEAQERIPVPDTTEQDEARLDAISQEKARQEQEAKRRQEQIDLTERKRQEQAEQQRRLAAQQEEDRQKRIAAEAFADDATGWVVPQTLAAETFGEELVGDILDWETNYLGTIPQGKRKGGFTDPQQAEHHEAEGRALAARMAEAIGADRIAYAPVGTVFPEAPERVYTNPRRIKLMADYGCHPVWSLDDEYGSNIDPEALGLSPALATDLNAWVGRFEDALDWDNPGAFREDDGFLARHEAEGRKLAIRVARELRDQGRGGIMVFLMTREFGVVVVSADEGD